MKKITSISMTELEYDLLKFYSEKSGRNMSRILVKSGLSEADDFVKSNGMNEEWEKILNRENGDEIWLNG